MVKAISVGAVPALFQYKSKGTFVHNCTVTVVGPGPVIVGPIFSAPVLVGTTIPFCLTCIVPLAHPLAPASVKMNLYVHLSAAAQVTVLNTKGPAQVLLSVVEQTVRI